MKQIDSPLQPNQQTKNNRVRKLSILASMLLGAFTSFAQTTLISPTTNNGGFESGSTGWSFAQTTGVTNAAYWNVGSVPGAYAGSNSAYITTGTTGNPWEYVPGDFTTLSNVRTSHMYQDVTFPSGETNITLTFQWKSYGETGWDRLLVYLAPTSLTPTSGTPASNSSTLTGATLLWTQPTFSTSSGANYSQATITITAAQAGNASANSTKRLIFTWQNDDALGTNPPASIDNITLISACQGVTTTTAGNLTPTTATLNWTAFSGASGYNVRYKKVADAATVSTWAMPTSVSGGTTTSLPITSLTANTAYEYQVGATGSGICTLYSSSSNFTTLCNASPLPQNQGFNVTSTTDIPSCWSIATVSAGSATAPAITFETSSTSASVSPFEGTRLVKFNSFNNNGGSIRLMSLPVSTSAMTLAEVEFKWYVDNSAYTSALDNVQIQYSLDKNTWTNIGSPISRVDLATTSGWKTKNVTFPTGAMNQPVVYIGFLFTSAYGNNCYMDDIKIRKVPTCFMPTALTPSNVKHNTATLGWTIPTLGVPVNYEYVVSTSSTTPSAAGTTITGTSVNLTGLTPNTTYYAFMRTNCGAGDLSDWTNATTFTTSCTPVAMPYTESFAATLPSCWSATEGASGASKHWATATADGTHGVSGPKAGTHFALLDVYNAQTLYNPYYLNLGPVTLLNCNNTIGYNYFLGNGGYTGTPSPLEVEIATSVTGPWTSIYSHTSNNSTFASNTNTSNWFENFVDLNSYSGQTVYLRFKSTSNYGSGITNQGIDEVRILPKKPTTTNTTQCGAGVPTCAATSNTGAASPSFRWYTVATGGSPITGQTGATLSGYSVSATTTFYVSEIISGIESQRTPAVATVSTSTAVNSNPTSQSICEGSNVSFSTSAAGSGTLTYTWEYSTGGSAAYTPLTNGGKYSGANSNTLTISGVTPAEIGSYRCKAVSNCGPANSIPAWLTVVPEPNVLIFSPKDSICNGQSLTLNAIALNAGTATYQWKKNGVNVGTNSASYNSTTFANNDSITCIITSTANCPARTKDTSNIKVLTVSPILATSLIITSDFATTGCVGIPVTFTAAPVNPGLNPIYQWKLNGVNVGSNSTRYTDSTMPSGSVIRCEMMSSYVCPSPANALSNTMTMTILPVSIATAYVKASPDTMGCSSVSYSFNSHFTNGGAKPRYQWMKNGQELLGDTLATYTPTILADNDFITIKFSSSNSCVFPITSAPITMHLTPEVTPDAHIYGIPFEGGILFSADLVNGGTNPVLQWRKNGKDIPGATGITYHATNLNAYDEITLFLVSDMECANPKAISSQKLTQERVTGINNVAKVFDEISLYPNPNEGKFTLRGSFSTAMSNKQASIEVLNAIGQTVYRNTVQVDGKEINVPIELSNSPASGMYMLQLNIDNQKESIRFILKQ